MTATVVSLERARAAFALVRSFDASAELDKLTDAQVAELLKEIHATFPVASPEACLLETAIARLARSEAGSIETFP